MRIALASSTVCGVIAGATLSFDADSRWNATGNSRVTLEGRVVLAQLDAPAGVTIAAHAEREVMAPGRYALRSGGVLIVS